MSTEEAVQGVCLKSEGVSVSAIRELLQTERVTRERSAVGSCPLSSEHILWDSRIAPPPEWK
jgi:hypothetical protein